jgi:hypothetical protein
MWVMISIELCLSLELWQPKEKKKNIITCKVAKVFPKQG